MTGSPSDLRIVPAAAITWVAAAVLVGRPAPWSLVVAVLAAASAVGLRRRPRFAVPAVVLAAVAVGCGWRLVAIENSPARALARDGSSVTATVVARSDARTFDHRGGQGSVLAVVLRDVGDDRARWSVHDRATAFFTEPVRVVTGDRLVVAGRLTVADATDEAGVLRVRTWRVVDERPWWWSASERVRAGVRAGVGGREDQAGALVPALVAGDESRLSPRTRDDFARSGLTHLLAVSGANLTIVLAVVLLLVRGRLGRRSTVVAALITVVAFVLVARPEPSVLRAAVMGAVAVTGLLVGARRGGIRAVAWAVIALLVLDPWLAVTAGFVLSVCATAGIVLFAPLLAARMTWLPGWAAQAVAVPCAAQLACLPVVASLSGEVSLVAVFANIAAAPAVAPATVAGLAAGLVALVSPGLAAAPGTVAWAAAAAIVTVARLAAGADGAALAWRHSPWWLVLVAPVTGWLAWRVARSPAVVVGLVVALALGIIRPPSPGWPPRGAVLVACDVGQGDGLVVPLGGGEAIVVDVGEQAAPVDRCLRSLGIDRIALLVFTHADADHVAGWRGAAAGRRVDVLADGPSGGPAVPATRRIRLADGDRLRVGAASIEVLWPRGGQAGEVTADRRNDLSLVLRVTVGGVRLLLTGDLGAEAQRGLARAHPDLRADVLKVAHHGSADHWPGLVDRVGPRWAVVSAGADNDFGHPAPATLATLAERAIPVARTDVAGSIAVVVRDGRLEVLGRRS